MKGNPKKKIIFNRRMEPEGKMEEDIKTKERTEIFICIREIKKIFQEINFPPPEQQTLFFSRFLTHLQTTTFPNIINLSDPNFPFPTEKRLMFLKHFKQNDVLKQLLEKRNGINSPVRIPMMKSSQMKNSAKTRSPEKDSQIEKDFKMIEMNKADNFTFSDVSISKVTLNLDSTRTIADFSDAEGDGFLSSEDLLSLKRLVEMFEEVEFNTQTPNDEASYKGNEAFSLKNIPEEPAGEEGGISERLKEKQEEAANNVKNISENNKNSLMGFAETRELNQGDEENTNLNTNTGEKKRRVRRISSLRDEKRQNFHESEQICTHSAKEIPNTFQENINCASSSRHLRMIKKIRSSLELLNIAEHMEMGFTAEKMFAAYISDGFKGLRLFRGFFLHDEWHAFLAHLRTFNLLEIGKDAEEKLCVLLGESFDIEKLTLRIGARIDLNFLLQEMSYKIKNANSLEPLDEYAGKYIPHKLLNRIKQRLTETPNWNSYLRDPSPSRTPRGSNTIVTGPPSSAHKRGISFDTHYKKTNDETFRKFNFEPATRFQKRVKKEEEREKKWGIGITGTKNRWRESLKLVRMPEKRPEADKNKEEEVFTAFGLGLFLELMQYGGKFEVMLLSKIVLDFFNTKDLVLVYDKWKAKKSAFSELVEFILPSSSEGIEEDQAQRKNKQQKYMEKIKDKEIWYSMTYFFKSVFSAEIKNRHESLIKFNMMVKDERVIVKELSKIFRVNCQLRIFEQNVQGIPTEVLLCPEGCGEKNIFVSLATEKVTRKVYLKSLFPVNIF